MILLVTVDPGHKDKLLRSIILDLLHAFDDEAAFVESRKRFQAHLNGTTPLWTDIRSTVYRAILSKADVSTYEIFLKVLLVF